MYILILFIFFQDIYTAVDVSVIFGKLHHSTCADPDGGQGVRTPLENHKNIGFFSNTGPDPLKNHKATKPAFNVGPLQHARKTPFKWRFAGWPMMAPF